MTSFTRYKRIISSRFICPCYGVGQSFYRRTYAVRIDLYTKYRHTCSKYVHVILHLHELCLGLIIKKKEKASGLFLACMPSKQHAPAPACHDKKPCRPYSYSRAGHAHVSAPPPLIGQWCEKKKRSHIRNVDGLHTSKASTYLTYKL